MGGDCIDPDLSLIPVGVSFTGCSGAVISGTAVLPTLTPEDLREGVTVNGVSGELSLCTTPGESGCLLSGNLAAADVSNDEEIALSIRKGSSIAGISGQYAFCNNRANLNIYDNSVEGIQGLDPLDTIDNNNNYHGGIPLDSPFHSDQVCGNETWEDLTPGGCVSRFVDCLYRERTSGRSFARATSSVWLTWPQAAEHCKNLEYAGYDDFRLPTQAELMAAYLSGMVKLVSANYISNIEMNASYWTGTTSSNNSVQAMEINPARGLCIASNKTLTRRVICVR